MSGWTTDLLIGVAEALDAAAVGTWRASGIYVAGETAIVIRVIPPEPERLITLAAYPVGPAAVQLADTVVGVQIRLRAGVDPRDCDDLADAVYDLLHGASRLTWTGIDVVQVRRVSYTSLGQDTAGRWERSENYYVDAMRPTDNNPD
jgi:hypothetical protein